MWEYAEEYKRLCEALRKAEKARASIMVPYYEDQARYPLHPKIRMAWASAKLSMKAKLTYQQSRKLIEAWQEQLEDFLRSI